MKFRSRAINIISNIHAADRRPSRYHVTQLANIYVLLTFILTSVVIVLHDHAQSRCDKSEPYLTSMTA